MTKGRTKKVSWINRPRRLILFVSLITVTIVFLNATREGHSYRETSGGFDSDWDFYSRQLIINPATQSLELQIAGRPVWSTKFSASKEDEVLSFFADLSSGSAPLFIANRHLYTGRGVYPDRELAIVADEIKVTPDKLQRLLPGRFVLIFSDGTILEVKSEVDAATLSPVDNFCFDLMRFIDAPLGKRRLQIAMDPTAALTLYHLAGSTPLVIIK